MLHDPAKLAITLQGCLVTRFSENSRTSRIWPIRDVMMPLIWKVTRVSREWDELKPPRREKLAGPPVTEEGSWCSEPRGFSKVLLDGFSFFDRVNDQTTVLWQFIIRSFSSGISWQLRCERPGFRLNNRSKGSDFWESWWLFWFWDTRRLSPAILAKDFGKDLSPNVFCPEGSDTQDYMTRSAPKACLLCL